MKTYADEILDLSKRAYNDSVILAGRDHSTEEFKSLLTRVASATEVFLKDHVYHGAHNKRNFDQLISGLEALGVPDTDRNALDELRRSYNKAKHEPTYEAPVVPVINILHNVQEALMHIAALRLGDSGYCSTSAMRRLLWFAAWDHFIGGDTEISIFLPCTLDCDLPWGFETVYVKLEKWETIKSELSTVGKVCFGSECVPTKFYDFWNGESDFLIAGSFEGDLRDMITVLARHERVEDLLPDLKRENEPYSMLAASLFAATDIARYGPISDDPGLITEAIIVAAGTRYAAPSTSKLVRTFSATIGGVLSKLPTEMWRRLTGPLWVSQLRYAELESERLLLVDELRMMILRDGRIVVKM